MLYLKTGKKGGGKSLDLVGVLLDVLEKEKRNVVTNLPLYLEEVQDEMIERGASVDVLSRVTILEPEQTRLFFLHRGSGVVLKETGDKDVPIDFSPLESSECPQGAKSVAYFIDEVQLVYPVRGWKGVPEALQFYNTQERKLGDDTWCAAQVLTHVDKQFRELPQEYHYVRNLSKEKFGRFKRGDNFEREVHYYPKTRGDEVAPEKQTFTLRVDRVARCYNTSAGIGISGQNADKGKKAKGWPLWSLWAAFGGAFLVLWFALDHLPSLIKRFVFPNSAPEAIMSSAGPQKPAFVDTPKNTPQDIAIADRSSKPLQTNAPNSRARGDLTWYDRSQVKVRGYVRKGSEVVVLLSDGRTVTEREFQEGDWIRRGSVRLQGETLYFVLPEPRSPATSAPPRDAVAADSDAGSSPSLPPPPPEPESSWETASDGVSRLRKSEALSDLVKR